MKNVLLVLSFLGLLLLMSDTDQRLMDRSQASVYFDESAGGESKRESLKVYPDSDSGEFVIEFNNFSSVWKGATIGQEPNKQVLDEHNSRVPRMDRVPSWIAQRMNRLIFKASSSSCQFLYTSPVLFNCNYAREGGSEIVAETRLNGTVVKLESLSSTLYEGSSLESNGKVGESKLYSVEFTLRVGKHRYKYTLFTLPNLVSHSIVQALAVAQQNTLSDEL